LSDKVAIITAGGSGIGAAAARRLASDGFRVAIFDTPEKAEALATHCQTFSSQSATPLKHINEMEFDIGSLGWIRRNLSFIL
jgi:NAD(P)-dependent dehydrogenase (short-subunit alcohol dehydrogenase family)